MMTRSGSFNVSNDYFKSTGRMQALVPATPRSDDRGNWSFFAGAAGTVVAVALVVAIFAHSSTSPASSPALRTTAPVVTTVAPELPASAPVVVTTPVAIAVEPPDAEIFREGKSLGVSPVVVEVPRGSAVAVDVKRSGYVTQQFFVDGKEPHLLVRLDKASGTPGVHPRPVTGHVVVAAKPATSSPKPPLGGGEIVNPWK
jgi:hypothetical protein